MTKQVKQISLNDLRDDSVNENKEVIFGKKAFGGYNPKEVSEYIKTLKDSLYNAENSFRSRLEEYAEITSMLTQERDKYMQMFKECEAGNLEMQQRVTELTKDNEAVNVEIQGLLHDPIPQDDHQMHEESVSQNLEMQKKLIEYNEYKDDSIILKDQLDELKLMVRDLNEQIEDYAKNEVVSEEYKIIVAENEIVKEQYDEAVYERSMLLAEKNILVEQNKRISESLLESNEKNKELRNINTTTKLKTRKLIAEFETRAYECAQNHRKNIDQITENIKSTLNILHYENVDISNLISSPYEKFDLEIDDVDAESKSG